MPEPATPPPAMPFLATPESTVPDPAVPGPAPLASGPRIAIRPFTHDDGDAFTAAARQSVAHHRPWLFPPLTTQEYAAYAAKLIEDPAKTGFLLCEHQRADRIAGFITINNIVAGGFRCGAIGYGAFAHATGRGLMREGLALVLRHAFGPLGLHRLEANIQPGNAASIGLVRGAGFRLEGFSPDFLFIDGAWRDHERWAITSEMVTG